MKGDRRYKGSTRSKYNNGSGIIDFLSLLLGFLLSYFLVRWLIGLIQRWLQRRKEPVVEPTFVDEAFSFDLFSESAEEPDFSFEFPFPPTLEDEFSFDIAPTGPPAALIPDPYYSVPSNILVESFEPKFQFNWQNPVLCMDIYPFRIEKLIDFLAFLTEIELLKDYRKRGVADPAIQAKIRQSEQELRLVRQRVAEQLEAAISARKQVDTYFSRITGLNERNLRFKQTYYLDREIRRFEEKLESLEDRKVTLLKRVDWCPPEDERRQIWIDRAHALDPEIESVKSDLADSKAFRELFEREAQLPKLDTRQITIEDVVRWEIREKRERWSGLGQEELLFEIIHTWFHPYPDRFPEWVLYMVIHFSGMRYKSAHGSWAEPRFLLELLYREDIEDQINQCDADTLVNKCNQAVGELKQQLGSLEAGTKKKPSQILVDRLQNKNVQKRALIEYQTSRALEEIERLPDDQACLGRLVSYKQEKDSSGDPIPEWVWAEIVKYTPLRLTTANPDWEASSPERWKYTNRQWQEILSTWQQKDITAWRKKHRESLELIVTRAVCNEIAEHIHHLRGLTPAAGLSGKPFWYLRQAAKDPQRAYFKQGPAEGDFPPGASILWLDWVDKQPNAWQIALPLPGFNYFPGQDRSPKPFRRGVDRQKDLERDTGNEEGWSYLRGNNSFARSRKLPSPGELRRMGKSQKEIQKILDERKRTGASEKQYLRWTHEAIVIDVVDLVDGRFVMTFETGKIGVILRRMSDLKGNPKVFVGYIPEESRLPEEMDRQLVEMLRWDRILPGVDLPKRIRTRK